MYSFLFVQVILLDYLQPNMVSYVYSNYPLKITAFYDGQATVRENVGFSRVLCQAREIRGRAIIAFIVKYGVISL